MNTKKRAVLPRQTDEQTAPPLNPATSLAALPPPARDPSGEAPMPSGEGFARQFFRAWTKRLMLTCGILAIALSAAVPLLSLVQVKEISLEGQAYYSEQTLLTTAAVSVGDELLSLSPAAIEKTLLNTHPYLETARVTRSLSGRLHIRVTERTPQWALYLSDTSVALVDETMQVLELTSDQSELCLVKWELFSGAQEGEVQQEEPHIVPGTPYRGNPEAIAKLGSIHAALLSLGYEEPPSMVDMSDRFYVTVHLSDGTLVALHECRSPNEQIRAALGALQAYRQQYGEGGAMLVDVDDFSRVSLRPLPSDSQ